MPDASVVDAARLRITLLDIDPAPWREVEVPLSMTFKSLHNTIQAAFLWFNYHLWEFDYDGKIYGVPFDDGMDYRRIYNAETARLIRLRKDSVKSFRYVYDMGDDWQHRIDVVSLFEQPTGTRLPRFVSGEWSRPRRMLVVYRAMSVSFIFSLTQITRNTKNVSIGLGRI